jgi:hypothetical protein
MVGNENRVNNYYNISNGKVVRSFGKTQPEGIKTVSRVNKNGDTVYELLYDYIEGYIVGAKMDSHDQYGDSIKLTMSGEGMSAELQIKFDSAYGRSFLFKMLSIDLSQELRIVPYAFVSKDTGKNITGLNIYQGGKKIENLYTKENPNGLPQLKEVKFNGKKQWDNTDQINFLKTKFEEFLDVFKNTQEPEAVHEPEAANLDELDF